MLSAKIRVIFLFTVDNDISAPRTGNLQRVRVALRLAILVLGALAIAYGLFPWRFRPGLTLSTGDLQMQVGKSDTVTGKFRITNNSLVPVRLGKVSGCSCMDLRFGNTYLLPFASTECEILVNVNSIKLGVWNIAAIKVNGHDNGLALRFLAYLGDSK